MTWPDLPSSFFVTTVAGTTMLVDRHTGRTARLDPLAALVIEQRHSFTDRDDAAAAMAELFDRPRHEVAAGLASFDIDLSSVTIPPQEWNAAIPSPVTLPAAAPAAIWKFDALGWSMEVTCHDESLVPVVASMLAAYPLPTGPVDHRFDIWDDGGIIVAEDGCVVYDRVDRPFGLAGLDGLITMAATATETAGSVLVHAAGVVDASGAAFVITGRSNQGKSTTTVELLASGWSYLTDEVVRMTFAQRQVHGLPRPIGLEGPMRNRRPELCPDWIDAEDANARWSVPPNALADVATVGRLGGLIVVDYRPAEPTQLEPLSLPDAVGHLIAQLYDTSRLDPTMITELEQMLANVPAVRLRHAGAPAAAAAIVEWTFRGRAES